MSNGDYVLGDFVLGDFVLGDFVPNPQTCCSEYPELTWIGGCKARHWLKIVIVMTASSIGPGAESVN